MKSKFEDPKQKDSLLNDISCPIKISGLIKHARSKKDDPIQFFLEESNKDTPIANFLIAIDVEIVKLVFLKFGLSHSRLSNSRIIGKSNIKELTNFCFFDHEETLDHFKVKDTLKASFITLKDKKGSGHEVIMLTDFDNVYFFDPNFGAFSFPAHLSSSKNNGKVAKAKWEDVIHDYILHFLKSCAKKEYFYYMVQDYAIQSNSFVPDKKAEELIFKSCQVLKFYIHSLEGFKAENTFDKTIVNNVDILLVKFLKPYKKQIATIAPISEGFVEEEVIKILSDFLEDITENLSGPTMKLKISSLLTRMLQRVTSTKRLDNFLRYSNDEAWVILDRE